MCIRSNMDLVFINAYSKVYHNSSICSEDIEEKCTNQGPVVYKRIKPICNPKPLHPDINVHAKF